MAVITAGCAPLGQARVYLNPLGSIFILFGSDLLNLLMLHINIDVQQLCIKFVVTTLILRRSAVVIIVAAQSKTKRQKKNIPLPGLEPGSCG